MPLPSELDRRLADLETQLPAMIAGYRTDGAFWMAIASEADLIEDQAGEYVVLIRERIQGMLAKHGRYLVGVDTDT